MSEVKKVLEEYLSEETNTINFHGDSKGVEWFRNMLYSGKLFEYESPDAFIIKNNEVLIIEHFEFDCYTRNRKGSKSKKEQYRIEQIKTNLPATGKGTVYDEIIHGDITYQNFCKNAIAIFDNHYKKIEKYKNNVIATGLTDNNCKLYTMFLIEDVSPVGSIVSDDKGQFHHVTLAHSREFINRLKKAPQVDFVLCASRAFNENQIWFIDTQNLSEYDKHLESYEKMRFFGSNPHVVGFKIAVSNNKTMDED